MAKKPAPAPAAPAVDPDRDYRVAFAKAHMRGRQRFSPMHAYVLKGRVLADVPAECIRSAEPIDGEV